MSYLTRSPSVGRLTKRILAINPDLTVSEIIAIVRECTSLRVKGPDDEFGGTEIIDEDRALEFARRSLPSNQAEFG